MRQVRGWSRLHWMELCSVLMLALSMLFLCAISSLGYGAERTVRWTVETAYPRDTAAGEAVDDFSRALMLASAGTVKVRSRFDTATGLDDVHMPVRGGDAVIASVLFASDLAPTSPVFQLSTLPFDVRSVGDAQQLARLAATRYRNALARSGYLLLMVVPWPPTGIWTRAPLATPGALSAARVRTYDQVSRNVFSSVSGEAVTLPVRDTMRELADGKVDAVLSSGDGEAGRIYAKHLRNFTAIRYAYPLSFMVMRQAAFETLPIDIQRSVLSAATETEAQLWKDLPSRIRRNSDQMQQMGIQVTDAGNPVMTSALHAAGDHEIESWRERLSPEDKEIMKTYETRCHPSADAECETTQFSGRAPHESD